MSNNVSEKTKQPATKQALTPKLRFPEFRDAGEWADEPFENLYSFKPTNSYSREMLNYEKGDVKNIHYGDIHTKFSTLFNIEVEAVPFITPSVSLETIKPDSYCVEGDIIFADASEDLDDIGKSIEIVNLNNEKLLSGLHTLLARQKEAKLIVGFGGYLFKSPKIRAQIKKESQGTKVLGISAGRLASIQITFPSDKQEQQKIADCLSSLDELITAEAKKLDTLRTYKKGLMQQLFPAEGETLPKLRFPEFEDAGDWENTTLGEVSTITSGGTPSRSRKEFWNGNIPWVTTSLIDFNTIDKASEQITEMGLKESSAKIFPKGTILMAMYGQGKTRGKVAVLGIEATTNQACAAILLRKELLMNFVFQNLASRYDELRELSNRGGQENLSLGLIEGIKIQYPKEENEQQKIADCLSSLDELIAVQTQKLERLKEHKKGLMQQLFPALDEVNG